MNKFYLIILFIFFTIVTNAQLKGIEVNVKTIEELSVKVIKFYPNPAPSVINFEFIQPVQKDYTLQVYNFVGKKVYELFSVSQKTIIPLGEFYRGVYIFQLRDKGGRIVESGKFQVAK